MIHKVERLVSIGKFRDYQAKGDVSFKKLTLIYGDNGSGKTTLASVLRSLTQNAPDIVKKRSSTNHTAPQAAQIVERDAKGNDKHHTFGHAGWSSVLPNLEVFDIHFINDNLYSGFNFSDEHKKQLHDFVIGAQAVTIRQQIEKNKSDKTTSRQTQESLEAQIVQQVNNGLTADHMTAFLNTSATEAVNIDDRIVAAQTALNNARASAVIQTLQTLSQLSSIESKMDFDGIVTDLQMTSQTIEDKALRAVFETHCADLTSNSIEGPETWTRTGYAYVQRKTESGQGGLVCPFCQQPVSDKLDILKAYALHFNEDFNALVQRIQTHLASLLAFNVDTHIQSLRTAIQTNTERSNTWAKYLPTDLQPPASAVADEAALRTALQEAISAVQSKGQNPSAPVATAAVTTLHSILQAIDSKIAEYNQATQTYNGSVATFRASIQTEQQAEDGLLRLKQIKKRFEPAIDLLCTQLSTEKQKLRALEQAYPKLIGQQEAAAQLFLKKYADRINHYLGAVFKTQFQIANVTHVPPKGKATRSRIDYCLTIDGQTVSFDSMQPLSASDCLSEGDKNTIALAFFLSKFDIDPANADKILVIDDPLSSFDSNRRSYTVQIVKDLLTQIKQVIVLSHNEFFLSALAEDPGVDKKVLRVSEDFTTKSCSIEPLDLDTMVQPEYFKYIGELEGFLASPDLSKKEMVLGLLRNVLEAHIRFKFHRQIKAIPGDKRTFGKLIGALETQKVAFRQDTVPPSVVSKLRMINSVSWKPHHGDPVPDYKALGVNPTMMNATELANLIVDAFDLIDNRL